MGTRTYSRRGVLTAAGRRRAGLEAIDIFGNPIPDRAGVAAPQVVPEPEPVAPPEPVLSPAAEQEVREDVARATRKKGAGLTKYLNDPETYPANTYDYYEGDESFNYTFNQLTSTGINNFANMKALGLTPENPEHQKIYIALMGINPKATRQSAARGEVMTESYVNGVMVEAGRRITQITDSKIEIENAVFRVTDPDDKLPGMGYAMLRKQAWAARKLGEITGKRVDLFTKALSNNTRAENWVGVHVWPKIGYNFSLRGNPILQRVVSAYGFNSTNTYDLMKEKLPDGRTGYSLWVEMVDQAADRSGTGQVWLKGTVTPTSDSSRGIQVLQNYGRKRGLSKGGTKTGEDGFSLTPEDDAYLGALWQKF
jgi:hypothetical protein